MAIGYTSTVNVAAAQWGNDTHEVVAADGVVQLAGSDPNRRSLVVYTDPSSVGVLYLVPNAGQHLGGTMLIPGAGWEFSHAAPVYAYARGGKVIVGVVSESGKVC